MKKKILKISIGFLFMMIISLDSCEKEVCKDCYRVGTSGIITATKITMCGEESISHLQARGYLCKDI